jgi:hypothetical protein
MCQNQFNQMNSVQNITSNSAPFMALPNITNYGNIIINYNIKNKKTLTKPSAAIRPEQNSLSFNNM